jgi:hypothetical protein
MATKFRSDGEQTLYHTFPASTLMSDKEKIAWQDIHIRRTSRQILPAAARIDQTENAKNRAEKEKTVPVPGFASVSSLHHREPSKVVATEEEVPGMLSSQLRQDRRKRRRYAAQPEGKAVIGFMVYVTAEQAR